MCRARWHHLGTLSAASALSCCAEQRATACAAGTLPASLRAVRKSSYAYCSVMVGNTSILAVLNGYLVVMFMPTSLGFVLCCVVLSQQSKGLSHCAL